MAPSSLSLTFSGLTLIGSRSTRKASIVDSVESSDDVYGLKLLNPNTEHATRPSAAIIFIHGLGGHSILSWCYRRNPEYFWPKLWLPTTTGLEQALVMSFGYDASILGWKPSLSGVSDFARALLMEIMVSPDLKKWPNLPIVFVAHSMGGLVVKEAFNASSNPNGEHFSTHQSIIGIVFLGTPHRGAPSAGLIHNLLKVAQPLTARQYLEDLHPESSLISTINDAFRNNCADVQLISFYETLPTAIGPISKVIVPKETASLQLPREYIAPLAGNHHNICKFRSDLEVGFLLVSRTIAHVVNRSPDKRVVPTNITSATIENVPSINIPFPRNPNFTGHGSTITALIKEFRAGQQDGFVSVAALYGIPGVGKSQIAIELAYRLASEFSIYWIRASSAEVLESEFAQLAMSLGLDAKRGNATRVVKDWLQKEARKDWIMVFDNADDISVLSDTLPHGTNGSVLITSRDPRLADSITTLSVEVETMSSEMGTQFFQRRAKSNDTEDIIQLVEILGGLPLAIEQAAAYIRERHCSVRDYSELLQSRRSRNLLLRRKPMLSRFNSESVHDTIAISLKKLAEEFAPAVELMNLSSFLDAQHLQISMFRGTLGASATWPDELDLLDSIETLQSFALVVRRRSDESFWIHVLVQSIVQEALESVGKYQEWLEQALRLVHDQFICLHTQEGWNQLQRHVIKVWSMAKGRQLAETKAETEKMLDMLQDSTVLLKWAQSHQVAENVGQDVYQRRRELYSPNDKRVLQTLRTLAMIQYDEANTAEAERMLRESLQLSQDWDMSNDGNAREIAMTRRCLAFVYLRDQKMDEAMTEVKAALTIELATHEQDLVEIAMTRQTIGGVYMSVENWEKAQEEIMIAYEIWVSEFGLKSKLVLKLLHNLGAIHRIVGQTQQAKEELQRALDNVADAFGPGSNTESKILHTLAEAYYDEREFFKAEETIKKALHIQELLFQPLHSEIGKSLFNLGITYWAMKRYDEALTALRGSSASREMAYGKNNIRVAQISQIIARVLFDMGNETEAQLLWNNLQMEWKQEKFGPDQKVQMRPNFSVTYSTDESEFKIGGLR